MKNSRKSSALAPVIPRTSFSRTTDTTVPIKASRALATAIPGARFEILEGASHIEASTLDPRLMRMVSEFLSQPSDANE